MRKWSVGMHHLPVPRYTVVLECHSFKTTKSVLLWFKIVFVLSHQSRLSETTSLMWVWGLKKYIYIPVPLLGFHSYNIHLSRTTWLGVQYLETLWGPPAAGHKLRGFGFYEFAKSAECEPSHGSFSASGEKLIKVWAPASLSASQVTVSSTLVNTCPILCCCAWYCGVGLQ